MCKKLGVTALVIVAALFVLHKLDLAGYAKVMWNRFHKNVQADIPPEMKIELLRAEIDKLVPKEAEARQAIADQKTQLDKQRKRIDEAKANLEKREASLK